MASASLLSSYLSTITDHIVPLTADAVKQGSKVFGAAVLKKDDRSLVLAGTNDESDCPLWHGEVNTIRQFYAIPRDKRPAAADCLFLTTHEPCSLCLSAIVWAGFDNFTYLFTYQDTKDAFAIPHDLAILHQVFRVPSLCPSETPDQLSSRPEYNRSNKFFVASSIVDLVSKVEDRGERERLMEKVEAVKRTYTGLSEGYQATKAGQDIPLS